MFQLKKSPIYMLPFKLRGLLSALKPTQTKLYKYQETLRPLHCNCPKWSHPHQMYLYLLKTSHNSTIYKARREFCRKFTVHDFVKMSLQSVVCGNFCLWVNVYVVNVRGEYEKVLKCYWIKKQIEPFGIHLSTAGNHVNSLLVNHMRCLVNLYERMNT